MHATTYADIFGAFLHDVTRSRNNNYAKHNFRRISILRNYMSGYYRYWYII